MKLTSQRNFTITLSENEASMIAQFLDSVVLNEVFTHIPDAVKNLHSAINTELMEIV